MKGAFALALPLAALAALTSAPDPACAQDFDCMMCYGQSAPDGEAPLQIAISDDLAFSRLAVVGSGGGSAAIDPQTGRLATQGSVVDLGGMHFTGHAIITGEAGRMVDIELPSTVTLTTPTGGTAELTGFTTDLPAMARLDEYGRLEFAFAGEVTFARQATGAYRGRIAITVDYR